MTERAGLTVLRRLRGALSRLFSGGDGLWLVVNGEGKVLTYPVPRWRAEMALVGWRNNPDRRLAEGAHLLPQRGTNIQEERL